MAHCVSSVTPVRTRGRGKKEGGVVCSTHPPNSHTERGPTPSPNSQETRSGGEDTADVGFGVQWGDAWDQVLDVLEGTKRRAQEANEIVEFVSGERVFALRPGGFSTGGGKGSFYAYRLEHQGLRFGLTRSREPSGDNANVRVNFGSLALMEFGGIEACMAIVKDCIKELGGKILWDKLGRVDMCVDMAGVDVGEFVELLDAGQYVTRAKSWSKYGEGRRTTSIRFGAGKVVMRVYDKLLESAKDARKYAVLVSHRWGFTPDCATRVEFQLRREALRTFGIDSVGDYVKVRGRLVAYLCGQWFRFTETAVDRTHTLRAENHRLWVKVAEVFGAWAGESEGAIKRVRRTVANGYQMVRQSIGCLVTAIVMEGDGVLFDNQEFCVEAWQRFRRVLEDVDVIEQMERKGLEWMARGPCEAAFLGEAA